MDFIPAENWYCKECLANNNNLENNLENATALIIPQDFREVYRSPPRPRANQGNRRRRATREARVPYNPLDGLFERMAEYRQLNNRSRSDRLEARRTRIDETDDEGTVTGGRRVKYKTRENDRFELQERRLIEEQEVLIREHLMNQQNGEGVPDRLDRSRSQDRNGEEEENFL